MTDIIPQITTPFDVSRTYGILNMLINEINAINQLGGPVLSVNGKTGVVVLTTADIADSTNARYVTDAELANIALLPNISGSAGSLSPGRTINGTLFDGTTNITISAAPSGSAGGDLTGTYPNPTIAKIQNTTVTGTTGTGAVVLDQSPTITTASLGSSTATTQTPGTNNTTLATTAFVANAVLGQNFKEACKYATTSALPSVTYSNGSSGVGATLTAVAVGAISIDGSSPTVGDRILVKNQVSQLQNGIYIVTVAGSGIAVFVLTRATDADETTDFKTGDSTFITSGSTLSTTTWAYTGIDSPTIGTDAISFVQTAGQGSFTAGNGISITGVSIAIDTSVTVDKTTVQTLTNKTLTSPTLTTPVLGTPSSGNLSNCTAYPLAQLTGAGTGVLTFLATPSSANLAAAVTDETGSGALVFGTSPTLVTPLLGTPTSGVLSNCTSATKSAGDNSTSLATTAYTDAAAATVLQNSQSAAYTTVLSDAGKQIYHPSSDNNPRTFTIDSNANVAYPIGTCLTFINEINTVTIAITSDTLVLAGTGSTGSRTLAANGTATAIKVTSTRWYISGTGIT